MRLISIYVIASTRKNCSRSGHPGRTVIRHLRRISCEIYRHRRQVPICGLPRALAVLSLRTRIPVPRSASRIVNCRTLRHLLDDAAIAWKVELVDSTRGFGHPKRQRRCSVTCVKTNLAGQSQVFCFWSQVIRLIGATIAGPFREMSSLLIPMGQGPWCPTRTSFCTATMSRWRPTAMTTARGLLRAYRPVCTSWKPMPTVFPGLRRSRLSPPLW